MTAALDAAIAQETARKTAKAVVAELVPPEVAAQLPAEVEQRLPAEVAAYIRAHPPKDGEDGTDGRDGTDGEPGLTWKGPWRRRDYVRGDAVERKGSSYIATTPTRQEPPGSGWDLLALKGKDGEAGGLIGVAGATGPVGPAGPPGTGGVPDGGTTGQVLTKESNADGDADWENPTGGSAFPPGGSPGQVPVNTAPGVAGAWGPGVSTLREQVDSGLVSVPGTGANTFLPWTKSMGSDLIDLTDPTLPTIIEAGVYAFNGFMTKAGGGTVYDITQTAWFGLDIDANGEDEFADVSFNLASLAVAQPAHVTTYCPVGAVLQAAIRQDTGFDYSFRFQCSIQRLS